MVNESPDARPRRRLRPTRRGKIVLVVAALLVVSAAVLIPLSLIGPDEQKKESPQSTLVIPEGWRASQVYAAARQTGRSARSPLRAAHRARWTLAPPRTRPSGNARGAPLPASYPIDSASEPAGLLRYIAPPRACCAAAIVSASRSPSSRSAVAHASAEESREIVCSRIPNRTVRPCSSAQPANPVDLLLHRRRRLPPGQIDIGVRGRHRAGGHRHPPKKISGSGSGGSAVSPPSTW
ncbi:hypothetical protein SMICM17S_06979 [Streptomyces microflavus]